MRPSPLLLILALLAPTIRAAAAPAPEQTPSAFTDRSFIPPGPNNVSRLEINALVADLASKDPATQKRAHESLASHLADAVPRLELLLRESKDPALLARAEAVLTDIRARARYAPALVTLHATDDPVALLAEIFRQARLPLANFPPNHGGDAPPIVNVQFDRRPFWDAAKAVCEASGFNVRRVYDDHRLTVMREQHPPLHGPSLVRGPAIVFARGGGNATRVGDANRKAAVQVDFLVEPRVRVVAATMLLDKCIDESAAPILPAGPGGRRPEFAFDTEFSWQCHVPLDLTRASTRVSRIKGTITLTVQLESETLDLPIKIGAPPMRKEVAGFPFDIKALDAVGDGGARLSLTLSRGDLDDTRWHWFRAPMRRLRLLDAAGHALRVTDSGTSGDAKATECTVGFQPSDGTLTEPSGPPARLVWEFPTKLTEVAIPFEFVDLPLPLANDAEPAK